MKKYAYCKNKIIGTREQGFVCMFLIDPDHCGQFEPENNEE